MVICLFAFPERDPGGFLPIANLNTNVCVEAVVGQMKPHHVFHVKGGSIDHPASPYTHLVPHVRPCFSKTGLRKKRGGLAGPRAKIPSKTEENGKLDKIPFHDVLS